MTTRSGVLVALGSLLVGAGCTRGRPAPGPVPSAVIRPTPVPPTPDTGAAADTTRRPLQTPPALPSPETPKTPPGTKSEATKRCVLDFENTADTRLFSAQDPSGKRTTYVGGGINGRCRGQDITIVADSSESYEGTEVHYLIGNVHYREPRAAIDAQRVTYYRAEERFVFEIDVRAEMKDGGGTMVGPRAEYSRPVTGIRDRARLVATQRPKLTYIEKDSLGQPQPPVTMDADQIVGEGDSTYYASGRVEMVRTDVVARGDSGLMDTNKKYGRLMRGPVIESKGAQPYTLRGRVIDLYGGARALERVVALDSATAVSKDLTLAADTIDLRVVTNRLQRAFAFGRTGATATTPGRIVLADSLDVVMPGQRVRELRAIGKAYVESDADTNKVKSDERDWLRGDTIVARFDSVAVTDTASRPKLLNLVARGTASSFYHVASNKGEKAKPGISYLRGRVIELEFVNGEVDTVTVQDKASGLYLEPATDTTARRRPTPGTARPPRPPGGRPPTGPHYPPQDAPR